MPSDDPALSLLSDPSLQATLQASVAKNTKKAYASDFAHFRLWCDDLGLPPIPASPATVIAYLHALQSEGRKTSTLERRLVSITKAHEVAGEISPAFHPLVRQFWKGVLRTNGRRKDGAEPMLYADLLTIVRAWDDSDKTPLTLRDRALLLVGWWGGLRREELSRLSVADVREVPQGVEAAIRFAKGDQEGEGAVVTLATQPHACPCTALARWKEVRGEGEGPLFSKDPLFGSFEPRGLTSEGVALRLRSLWKQAGMEGRFSPHSLRSGIATQLALWGVEERLIQRHLRHKNVLQTRRYIRMGDLWKDNALLQARDRTGH